jgi:type IV pilus assembly protein PilC
MKFAYKAIGPDGQVEENIREASDAFALAKDLKTEGKTLITAEEQKRGATLAKLNISFGGVKLADKITFAKNLAAMIDAGLALSRALSVMERQTKSKKFKETLRDLEERVQTGAALSEGLSKHPDTFSSLFVSMVRAGEESGKLGESLRIVADQMDRTYSLQRKVRGAMMYPAIIMSVMVIIGILMLIFVVPTLTATFTELGVKLPASTRLIIAFSEFLKHSPLVFLAAIAFIIVGCIAMLRSKRGRRGFEWLVLRFPVIGGLVKQTNTARMARTFSSLLSSGVEVVSALSITGDVMQNSYYKEVFVKGSEDIQKGAPLSGVFAKYDRLFPPMVGEMIAVGEETGKLPSMLLQIATFFESEVEQKTKDMSTIIEPFLMVIIGAAVGFFAVSMITPIYSISNGL